MALPYADAVANLKAGGLTGTNYTNALSSLNNAYGVGTPTGTNAGAAAAEPVSTAIPTTSPSGTQTFTTPQTQSALQANNLPQYQQTGAAVPPAAGATVTQSTPETNGTYFTSNGNGTFTMHDEQGRSVDGITAAGLSPSARAQLIPAAPPPTTTQITSPVAPPTNTTNMFTLPQGNAASTVSTYQASLQTTLDAQKAQLSQALQSQQSSYETKIDALSSQNDQYKQLEQAGLSGEGSSVQQETAAKQAALQQEQDQFQAAYDAKTALINEMDGLLTTGNQLISDMKNTTGLTSIMTPRVSQTMADVTARAGVITALLSAQDGQIGVAQNQLKSTTDALTSIYGDQINYYQNVVSFYDNASKVNDTEIASLSADQKTYVDAQISMLQDQVKNTEANVNTISAAMLDPTKALAYASAGVSLNDTPAQINAKLATYQYSQELSDTSSKMSAAGYSEQPVQGVTPVTITDSQGKTTLWYQTKASTAKIFGSASGGYYTIDASGNAVPVVAGSGGAGGTGGAATYPKGKLSSSQYVSLSLQRAGIAYKDALAKVPAGKVGVVDNATGAIGYINPTEYTTKQYTYL